MGIKEQIKQLEEITATDIGRNIDALATFVIGDLYAAADSIIKHPAPHIAIVTGFFIPNAIPPAPETDGITGALLMAKTFHRLQIPVQLISDDLCSPAISKGVNYIDNSLSIPIESISRANAIAEIEALKTKWKALKQPVSHIIFIERVGPSSDGTCRNMIGNDISDWTAPLHKLMEIESTMISIGIGDGGNEIGMGKIPKHIITNSIDNGSHIACCIPCDHLIVAGVSNWGATALLLSAMLLKQEWKNTILPVVASDDEFRILKKLTESKLLVDGVLKTFTTSVDGLDWSFHQEIQRKLLAVSSKN